MGLNGACFVPLAPARAVLAAAGFAACLAGADAIAQTGAGVSAPPVRETATRSAAQSGWVRSHESSARLIAGAMPGGSDGRSRMYAGVELRLSEGWKTYWRHPGDDGGLPPTFDWSGSRNLKAATVSYPAPKRLEAKTGTSIGYEGGVVFPVSIEAVDPARPVELVLRLEYGICREICVPAEVGLQLAIPSGMSLMPGALAASLAAVPRQREKSAAVAAGLPALVKASAVLKGPGPALMFDIAAGAGGAQPDLFIEVAGGMHLPMAKRIDGPAGGVHRFRIDLKGVDEIGGLPGRSLILTMTGGGGGTEAVWTVP
jgi:DsbC/DsbD-like thiol-disulfide interchange protein